MRRIVVGTSLAMMVASAAQAVPLTSSIVDFEVLPDGTPPTEGVVDQPLVYDFETTSGINTVSFRAFALASGSPGTLGIAKVGVENGGMPFGFYPEDTPDPSDAFGSFFLTTALETTSLLEVTYKEPVKGLNFDLGDVDGLDQPGQSNIEVFTVEFFNGGGNLLGSRQYRGDDPNAGNQSVINVSFESGSENIKSILVTGTTDGGTRLIGIAFDNFDPDSPTSVVPVPPSLPLAAVGIAALGILRMRRKAG